MAEEPKASALALIREIVTAALAVGIIASGVAAIIWAGRQIGDATKFKDAKDILLFINPILGVVIGYYFNKTASENRGDRAEAAAASAAQVAMDSSAGKAQADARRGTVTNALRQLTEATKASPGTAGVLTGKAQSDVDLAAAIRMAEQVLSDAGS